MARKRGASRQRGARQYVLDNRHYVSLFTASLDRAGIPFKSPATLRNRDGTSITCDIAVPDETAPAATILARPFDVVEDDIEGFIDTVCELAETTRDLGGLFFLVTDGYGWRTHQGHLKRLVNLQNFGMIEMIFTLDTRDKMVDFVKDAYDHKKAESKA